MGTGLRRLADKHAVRDGLLGIAGIAERAARRRTHLLPVLTYHRVVPASAMADACPGTASTSTEGFVEQMRFVAEHRHAVSAAEVVAARRGDAALPPGAVLVTFDDGYEDFVEHAWPVLRRFGLPAVMFVPTGPVEDRRAFWWERLWSALLGSTQRTTPRGRVPALPLGSRAEVDRAYRTLREALKALPHDDLEDEVERLVAALGEPAAAPRALGWDALRRLWREGLDVAPHTVTHPLLTKVGPRRRMVELTAARDELHRQLGPCPPLFAYPSGDCDDEVAADVGEAGYEVAFTTERSVNDLRRADWLRLGRVNVGPWAPCAALRAQMAPPVATLARVLA